MIARSNFLCCEHDLEAVGTIFNLVMMRCQAEIRTYHLPDDERMRYVLNHGRGYNNKHYISIILKEK